MRRNADKGFAAILRQVLASLWNQVSINTETSFAKDLELGSGRELWHRTIMNDALDQFAKEINTLKQIRI